MPTSPFQQDALTVEDVLAAPMPQQHKDMVIMHLTRLQSICAQPRAEDFMARSMTESVAHEQLAKMAKIFRSYQERRRRGELPDEVESMMTDLIDGCILSSLTAGQWEAEFPRGRSRKRGPSSNKQKLTDLAEETDDDTTIPEVKVRLVNPSPSVERVMGEDQHWRDYFSRPRTQSEVRSPDSPIRPCIIRDRPAFTRKLSEKTPDKARGYWPLTPKDEQEYYATGGTGAKGGEQMGWNWSDLLGWKEE